MKSVFRKKRYMSYKAMAQSSRKKNIIIHLIEAVLVGIVVFAIIWDIY